MKASQSISWSRQDCVFYLFGSQSKKRTGIYHPNTSHYFRAHIKVHPCKDCSFVSLGATYSSLMNCQSATFDSQRKLSFFLCLEWQGLHLQFFNFVWCAQRLYCSYPYFSKVEDEVISSYSSIYFCWYALILLRSQWIWSVKGSGDWSEILIFLKY